MNPIVERTLGFLLRGVRGHDKGLAWNDPVLAGAPDTILLTSPAFAANGPVPQKHAGTGVGPNIAPPLGWSKLPAGTVELAIIIQDPDAPLPKPVVHCVAAGISPERGELAEGALGVPAQGLLLGKGTMGQTGYAGPRPVLGHGVHRYVFQIVASSRPLQLKEGFELKDLVAALNGAALAKGRLIGTYVRP